MAGSVDNYYWDIDNVTELCASGCYAAVQFWNEDVSNRCVYDSLVAYNKNVPAASVTGRYTDGMNIACLTNQKYRPTTTWGPEIIADLGIPVPPLTRTPLSVSLKGLDRKRFCQARL